MAQKSCRESSLSERKHTLDRRRVLNRSKAKHDACKTHQPQPVQNGLQLHPEQKEQPPVKLDSAVWESVRRRQIRIVLEDVLDTEMGKSFLSRRGDEGNDTSTRREELKDSLLNSQSLNKPSLENGSPQCGESQPRISRDSCASPLMNSDSPETSSSLSSLSDSSLSVRPQHFPDPVFCLLSSDRTSDCQEADVLLLEESSRCPETSDSDSRCSSSLETRPEKKENGEREVVDQRELRGSVLRLSVGAAVPHKRFCLERLDDQILGLEEQSSIRHSSRMPSLETIVLSSEEESEADEDVLRPEAAEEDHLFDECGNDCERSISPENPSRSPKLQAENGSVVQLKLSSLHMGGISVESCGSVEISTDIFNILLEDISVEFSVAMADVCKYSVWEGTDLEGCGLSEVEDPPPSLLLLWLSAPRAEQLLRVLSSIQPRACPDEQCWCLLVCLTEPVAGVQAALLASLMDIVGLNNGRSDLFNPLTHAESLQLLQHSEETHLLRMLTSGADASHQDDQNGTEDSEAQQKPVSTLCRRLIQFPPPPTKGGITVTTEDLDCLDSGEFLNDVIVDFYLKYLLEEKAPRDSVERSHVFSSFFCKQLTRRDHPNEDVTSSPAQVRRHQRVKTWTRHVDIFDKDFLFVPVNQEAHWYLVVICFPGMAEPQYVNRRDCDWEEDEEEEELEGDDMMSRDEDKDNEESCIKSCSPPEPLSCTENTCRRETVCQRPCILIMDSLKLSVHERICKLLREYLQVEWEAKKGRHREFNGENMEASHCIVPLQDNSSDCGLYLLHYAESFLQDPILHFDFPLRLEQWFPRQQVKRKREEIRELILNLSQSQQALGSEAEQDRTEEELF